MQTTNKTRGNSVFIISTPLHLFHAIAASISECKELNSILIFIDQPIGGNNLYVSALESWIGNPFTKIHTFHSQPNKTLAKYKYRKQVLNNIANLIESLKPIKMYTGNDRRIEFICGYAKMKSINTQSECIYLDDGIMSYVVNKYTWESPLEIFIKKLYYGFWYKRFQVVGASDFIDSAVLAFPEKAHQFLKRVPIRGSNNSVLTGNDAKQFSKILIKKFDISFNFIKSLEYIQILPHRIELKRFEEHFTEVKKYLLHFAKNGKKVGIKYHPFEKIDYLDFSGYKNIHILPSDLAFEALLPFINENSVIVGDLSTVLLTAKWLRPNLNIISIQNPNDVRYDKILPLMKDLDINIYSSIHDFLLNKNQQSKSVI